MEQNLQKQHIGCRQQDGDIQETNHPKEINEVL
jgi:hypothetical protein